MNITYTPADEMTFQKDRMSSYDAAVSREYVRNSTVSYKKNSSVEDSPVYDKHEVESLVIRRFWSVFILLFIISTLTAWMYVNNEGATLDLSSLFVGTLMMTVPAALLHANYFKSKICS